MTGRAQRIFARHVIDNFLGDAFRYGVFHADLHPANLLVLPGEEERPAAIGGDPKPLADAIRRYREAGCDHAILNFSLTPFGQGEPGLPGLLAPLLDSCR